MIKDKSSDLTEKLELSTFDFTGICNRYIDGNGYSLRIGGDDLGTRYRLTVVKTGQDVELLAAPTRDPSLRGVQFIQEWFSPVEVDLLL